MKTKAQISCAETAQLICAFVFTRAKIRFSHDAAQTLAGLLKRNHNSWYKRKYLIIHKPKFCKCETEAQTSIAVTVKLISAFVFATRTVQSLFYLNPKFQASSLLLWLYRLVCVGPGRKPTLLVLPCDGSHICPENAQMHVLFSSEYTCINRHNNIF